MIEVLDSVLPIVINILLIVLITVSIIAVIKCIYLLNKAKSVCLNIEEKVNSVNSLFNVINTISDKAGIVTDRAVDIIIGFITSLFTKDKHIDESDTEFIYEEENSKKKKERE